MLKGVARDSKTGKQMLLVGFTPDELRKLMRMPGKAMCAINAEEAGIPIDVLIFAGLTNKQVQAFMQNAMANLTPTHEEPSVKQ
jgi:hypothetical protein